MKKIPYGSQYLDKFDLISVKKSLLKKIITTGKNVIKFENLISNYVKSKYVSVCNSGTSALFLALKAIDVKKDDIIIMPSVNFIASYNCSKILGAKVYLADVDEKTGQMSPENIIDCCQKFKLRKVKAIILMYNGGYPKNADKFYKLKKKLKCFIIEDACHAFGASYIFKKKRYLIGCAKHSDICTFSLHPLKTITTGEGGIVTTNNKQFDDRIKSIRSLGIKKKKNYHWKYDVNYLGLNFRLTDFQCALGISQLKKINKFLLKRKTIVDYYNKHLCKIKKIIIPNNDSIYNSSYHLYIINIKNGSLRLKDRLIKYMLNKNIYLQYHYIPIYKFKIFQDKYIGIKANIYHRTAVSLPIYYDLNKKQLNFIINSIKNFFNSNA